MGAHSALMSDVRPIVGRAVLTRSLAAGLLLLFPVAASGSDTPNAPTPAAFELASAPIVSRSVPAVPGSRTPSGFDVPRFVSLKFGKVNARTGPSRNHSIAYQYRRRGLPLMVVAETEMWRKVRDPHGDEAWVRKPALSGERSAVVTADTDVRSRPETASRRIARIERGALVRLGGCETTGWCKIVTDTDVTGHVARAHLWGVDKP